MPTVSNFPATLDDGTTLPAVADTAYQDDPGVLHDEHHSVLADAVQKAEARIGVTGSAVSTSLTKRVATLETAPLAPATIAADVAAIASPPAATAETVATTVNAILTALKNAGLMS